MWLCFHAVCILWSLFHILFDLLFPVFAQVSYVSVSTRETYSKVGRELLAVIASAHPHVICVLLERLRETIQTVGMVRTAFSKLQVLSNHLYKWYKFYSWMFVLYDLDGSILVQRAASESVEATARRNISDRSLAASASFVCSGEPVGLCHPGGSQLGLLTGTY